MTSAVHRSTPSLSIPPSQSTAPVFEHNCLFTHDIKRKQKRWNDGILRYHTFNRRIMVFDAAGNRVGDTHWTGSAAIQEGDEVTLEKWGVIVDVADCIRKTETDLSELRTAQARSTSARSVRTPSRAPATVSRQQASQLKHRSLNSLLKNGTNSPGGVYGSAKSPYELLHAGDENQGRADERPAKRQRIDAITTHRAGVQTPLQAKATARNLHLQPFTARDSLVTKDTGLAAAGFTGPPRRTPQKKVVVDLCEDDETEPADYAELWNSDSQISPEGSKRSNQHDGLKDSPNPRDTPLKQVSRRLATSNGIRKPLDQGVRSSNLKNARTSTSAAAERQTVPRVSDEAIERRETGGGFDPALRGLGTTLKMIATTGKKKRTLLCQDQLSQRTRVPAAVLRSNRNIAAVLLDSTQDSDEEASSSGSRNAGRPSSLVNAPNQLDAPGPPLLEAPAKSINPSTESSPTPKSGSPDRPLDPIIQPPGNVSSVPNHHPRQPPTTMDKAASNTLFGRGAASAKPPSFVAEKSATVVQSDPLRKFKRRTSVTVTDAIPARGQEAVISEQPETASSKITGGPPEDIGPWSREAFDLFVWRPPGWNEEKWSVVPDQAAA